MDSPRRNPPLQLLTDIDRKIDDVAEWHAARRREAASLSGKIVKLKTELGIAEPSSVLSESPCAAAHCVSRSVRAACFSISYTLSTETTDVLSVQTT